MARFHIKTATLTFGSTAFEMASGPAASGKGQTRDAVEVTALSDTFLILRKTEELEMEETAFYIECFQSTAACASDFFRDLFIDIIETGSSLVDHVHDRFCGNMTCREEDSALRIANSVKCRDFPFNELFHNIRDFRFISEELFHFVITADFPCCLRTDAAVRFYNDRITGHFHEGIGVIHVRHHLPSGRHDPCLRIVLFHLGFASIAHDLICLQTGRDIEIRSQSGILLHPVLVIALDPIHFPVSGREITHRAYHLVIIFQIAYLIVFCQGIFQLPVQVIIRSVANSQYIDAIIVKSDAKT